MIQRIESEQRDFRATIIDVFKNSQENTHHEDNERGDSKVRNENLAGWTYEQIRHTAGEKDACTWRDANRNEPNRSTRGRRGTGPE